VVSLSGGLNSDVVHLSWGTRFGSYNYHIAYNKVIGSDIALLWFEQTKLFTNQPSICQSEMNNSKG